MRKFSVTGNVISINNQEYVMDEFKQLFYHISTDLSEEPQVIQYSKFSFYNEKEKVVYRGQSNVKNLPTKFDLNKICFKSKSVREEKLVELVNIYDEKCCFFLKENISFIFSLLSLDKTPTEGKDHWVKRLWILFSSLYSTMYQKMENLTEYDLSLVSYLPSGSKEGAEKKEDNTKKRKLEEDTIEEKVTSIVFHLSKNLDSKDLEINRLTGQLEVYEKERVLMKEQLMKVSAELKEEKEKKTICEDEFEKLRKEKSVLDTKYIANVQKRDEERDVKIQNTFLNSSNNNVLIRKMLDQMKIIIRLLSDPTVAQQGKDILASLTDECLAENYEPEIILDKEYIPTPIEDLVKGPLDDEVH